MSTVLPREDQQSRPVSSEEEGPGSQTKGKFEPHEHQQEPHRWIKHNNESGSIAANSTHGPDESPGLPGLSSANEIVAIQAGSFATGDTGRHDGPAHQSQPFNANREESVVNESWTPQFAGDHNDRLAPPPPLNIDNFDPSLSVCSSEPSFTTRRDNPNSAFSPTKHIEEQASGFVPGAAQHSDNEDTLDPASRLDDGTLLYRACESVPFILVTSSCLEAIRRSVQTDFPQGLLDTYDFADENALGPMDKALIKILILLLLSVESRNPTAELTLQGTHAQGHCLAAFKDIGPVVPEPIYIGIRDFFTMCKDWKQFPNPALCSNDRPDVRTPWSEIMQILADRNVSLDVIDASIHFKLTQTPAGEELDKEIDKIRLALESGRLVAMKNMRESYRRPDFPHHETSFNYIEPMTRDRNTVFSLRFTHETPQGKLEDKRGHVDAFFANDESDIQRRKPKLKEGLMGLKAKKKQWARTSCGRRTKVVVSVVLVIIVLATVLVLYFKLGSEQGSRIL
jgi:hypothetical protein